MPLHITQRGKDWQACFFSGDHRYFYLAWLQEYANKTGCEVPAYVLMTNQKKPWSVPQEYSMLGRIPTKEEYIANTGVLDGNAADIYRYMNFDKLEEFSKVADTVQM